MIKVIKIGGNVIDDIQKMENFLQIFSRIDGEKILIHGGGKIATEIGEKLGISTQMIDGKRVTNAETLKLVTMVYAGLINKNIVAKLQALKCNAIGLTGADANIIPAKKRKDSIVDWGFVGDVNTAFISVSALQKLLDAGFVPVFCAITHDSEGNLLNTNADTIAYAVAGALAKVEEQVSLIYCFEKKGVLKDINDENSVVKKITPSDYEILKQDKIVNLGMIPKLDNAFLSLKDGVKEVRICNADDLNDFQNAGTCITL